MPIILYVPHACLNLNCTFRNSGLDLEEIGLEEVSSCVTLAVLCPLQSLAFLSPVSSCRARGGSLHPSLCHLLPTSLPCLNPRPSLHLLRPNFLAQGLGTPSPGDHHALLLGGWGCPTPISTHPAREVRGLGQRAGKP